MNLKVKAFVRFKENLLLSALVFILTIVFIYNKLLFHSLVEFSSCIISASIFMLALNIKKYRSHPFYTFIGITYLFITFLIFFHFISYPGFSFFSFKTINVASQVWIVTRILETHGGSIHYSQKKTYGQYDIILPIFP